MPPQAGVNGVLPVAVLHKNPSAQTPRGPKVAQPRLKLLCRRLPPGLTEAEFKSILGNEWKLGAGRIDWMSYRKGKISKDAAKPSKPARVYVHVTKQDHVKMLGDQVREATFHDAAKSWQDSALVGPPVVEYAAYPKMPGGRRRNDNRQGTIDQDQEFKDFLESLTNPITKTAAPEADAQKQDKVKTTPLIEALREKKANKEKPNGKASRHARGEGKEDIADKKMLAKSAKENALNAGDKNRRVSKAEKAKEAVKILNKEATSLKDADASASTDKAGANPAPERKRGNVAGVKSLLQRDLGLGGASNRRRGTKREVASAPQDGTIKPKDATAAAAAEQKVKEPPPATTTTPAATSSPSEKSTQSQRKDRPTRAERRAFKASLTDKTNDKTPASDAKAQTPTKTSAPAPQILKKPQLPGNPPPPRALTAPRAPPTEPAATRGVTSPAQPKVTPAKAVSASLATSNTRNTPVNPVPASTSKQAFLKHANPSQGITEPLIEETLRVYGAIDKVEIDKRKGFAYVDFSEPEGLQKAMVASPIKIAQGAVQVLERKEKVARTSNPRFNGPPPTGPARGGHIGRGGFGPRGRGGRSNARGGGHVGVSSTTTSVPSTAPTATAAVPASVNADPTP